MNERFEIERVRRDFPALNQEIRGAPLVYLDSAATALKPRPVIDALMSFYARDSANIHRGVHTLSYRATQAYEGARKKVQSFLHAKESAEIVFVRGTTEAINLVAASFGGQNVGPGDEIVLTELEHHSNIVPWQMLCARTGATLSIVPVTDRGEVNLEAFAEKLGPKTRLVSVSHVSNALGTVLPVREIARLAHERGAVVIVDGAQAAPHLAVDVQDLECDFYAFSGHKLYGPTGVGVLYGRRELLERMPPYQGGGDMIRHVTFEKTVYNDVPYKFEAGTPPIGEVVALGAAIDYVSGFHASAVRQHEESLLEYGTRRLLDVPGLTLVGTAPDKIAILSFVIRGVHAHDLGTLLDARGVAVRTGHHCAEPLLARLGLSATTRASLAIYNRREDIDALALALGEAASIFGRATGAR